MTYPPDYCHSHYGTEGDTANWYLALSEYETWRYMDSAATEDRFWNLDDYNVALISSHMNPTTIGLSTPFDSPGAVTADELNGWYTTPPPGSLVIFSGCGSASPGLFGAVSEAGTIAGYEGSVGNQWAVDSIGMLFENMYNRGDTQNNIGDAQNYVQNTYGPWWSGAGGPYPGQPTEPLVIVGDTSWTLGGPNDWVIIWV